MGSPRTRREVGPEYARVAGDMGGQLPAFKESDDVAYWGADEFLAAFIEVLAGSPALGHRAGDAFALDLQPYRDQDAHGSETMDPLGVAGSTRLRQRGSAPATPPQSRKCSSKAPAWAVLTDDAGRGELSPTGCLLGCGHGQAHSRPSVLEDARAIAAALCVRLR